jgi:predicted RNase H-like nuclease (RuvC/YqgF family)
MRVKPEEFENLQSIHKSFLEKLSSLELSSTSLSSDLNSLVDEEISLSNKLESIQNSSIDKQRVFNQKLLLETQSKSNTSQLLSNIYKTIESLSQKVASLSSTWQMLSCETNHLEMVNSHLSALNSFQSSSLSSLDSLPKQKNPMRTSLLSLEKLLCPSCQSDSFGFSQNSSGEKTEKEACSNCGIS